MADQSGRRCAVVFNPTKVSDDFRDTLTERLEPAGLDGDALAGDQRGRSRAAHDREAVDAGVDLVIAAGGDGTVRVVADGLAGTGIPMGLVPAGTGKPARPQPRHPAERGRGDRRGPRPATRGPST